MLVFLCKTEDGIRVGHVTGVQTCDLPISLCIGWYRIPYPETRRPSAGDSPCRWSPRLGIRNAVPPDTQGTADAPRHRHQIGRADSRKIEEATSWSHEVTKNRGKTV